MYINIFKIKRIVAAICSSVLLSSNVYAADISALNFNGDLLGKVIPDGSVINFNNELIGHITADGFVINNENDIIGGLVPQGVAVSYNNSILGKVNNDGSVTAINDNLVGKVLPNGLVVNDNFDVLGAIVSPGLVYDDKGGIAGRIAGDGKFYNLSGNNTGYVTASGYVYSVNEVERTKSILGKLMPSKIVLSPTGKFLGSVTPDGKVMDLKKNIIGTVHANGFVYNNNSAIGHIAENGYAFAWDGSYLGIISYNGEVLNRGKVVANAVFGGRILNKDGENIGFSVDMSATANDLNGNYLGRITLEGNIVKGRNWVGKIGASGKVVDKKGVVIGAINAVGPVFDHLGFLQANAAVGGHAVSLDGIEIGFVQGENVFDRSGKNIGRTIGRRLNFDNTNNFLGISGISSLLEQKGKKYQISPYGYVFDENLNLVGNNFPLTNIVSPNGELLAYTSESGQFGNRTMDASAKLTGTGFAIDKSNQPLGKIANAVYATDFSGESLGYINPTNIVINDNNVGYSKILADGSVVSLENGQYNIIGRANNAVIGESINGDFLGLGTSLGKIKKEKEIIGKISSSGYVIDNMGSLYGGVIPFGTVVSESCEFRGVVSETGDARTTNNAYLGMILANNRVVNEAEEQVGHIVSPALAFGNNSEPIGVLTSLGVVLNYDNQNLGCTDAQGKVRNNQKEIVGQIIPSVNVMDFENRIIGRTNFRGAVVGFNGNELARIDLDGNIHNSENVEVGVLFKYTVAFDEDNIYLGRVTSEGEIVSDSGEVLGKVNYNGQVITKSGKAGFALYDLYVYDNENKTIGYIAKNGRVYSIMGEVKGSIYQGFALDKKQNLIGRGARDYYIRDDHQHIIGFLNLDGSVVDTRNVEVGQLSGNGGVVDKNGLVIAEADDLQYYHLNIAQFEEPEPVVAPEPIIPPEPSVKMEPEPEPIPEPEPEEDDDFEEIIDENIPAPVKNEHGRVVGIAITPGGRYLGDVYEDNKVIGEDGKTIGTRQSNGDILSEEGETLGVFQGTKPSDAKMSSSKWYELISKNAVSSPYDFKDRPTNVGVGGGIGPGGRYNPRRAEILAQLQDERRKNMKAVMIPPAYNAASYTGWQDDWGLNRSISSLRVDMSNLITADKPIPAVLARSLISLGGSPVTAIVERNVYGDTGRNIIIPAGSRIIGGLNEVDDGTSRFDGTSGGVKLEINWNRIIRPDGIAFILNSPETGDAQGRGGGALGYVDEQLVKKYTLPVLGTIASSAITYLMATDESGEGETESSKQQAASDAREQFMTKMDEMLQQIIDSKSLIQPVTYVPAGTRIIIYPMVDLWLRSTKDIEKGTTSMGVDGPVKDVLIDDHKWEEQNETPNNQNNNGQQVVLGNKATENNGASNSNGALISDTPPNNQNNNTGNNANRNNIGALPPPATDGSITDSPVDDEDSDELELF